MSYPSVIERPLLSDELSIYLDNKMPIPLAALGTFLSQLDKATRNVEGMDGLFLELSDFAVGSNELRFRVVGPGRVERDEAIRKERALQANEKSATAAVVGAGAAVVSAVAAVVAVAISAGNANPSAYRITNNYDVTNIYVQAPKEPPHVITRKDIEQGRKRRLTRSRELEIHHLEAENDALLLAMSRHEAVKLGGWFYYERGVGYFFESMKGNHFRVQFSDAERFVGPPVAIETFVHSSPDGIELEISGVIATLSDY